VFAACRGWSMKGDLMQCPIPVQGRECGADARTRNSWIAQRDEVLAIHFDCTEGHRFHIGPRARWQTCRCDRQEETKMSTGRLMNNDVETMLTLAAQKGIQVIMPEIKFTS
jgi:hypothetical protein